MAVQLHAITSRHERFEPSDRYGWSAILKNTVPLFSLLWLAPVLADKNPYAAWALTPFVGLLVYRTTVVMHDCTHYTLFTSRRLNKVMGSLLGAVTGVDFRSFSRRHWRHHRSYGERDDPQGFHYVGMRHLTPVAFRWHVAKPLLGLNVRRVFAESIFAPKNAWRLIATGEFAIVAVVQTAMLTTVTAFGRHPELLALPVVSAATFGLFFSQLRGMAEHGALGDDVEKRHVRSHRSHWIDRVLLYDVNFNYHREHHENPQVPSYHLPAVASAAGRTTATGSMFTTIGALHAGSRAARAAHV